MEQYFTCSITGEIMVDPVITEDGNLYERQAIERWFQTKKTSPLTGSMLSSTKLIPVHSLREFLKKRPPPVKKEYYSLQDAWNKLAKGKLSNVKMKEMEKDDPVLEYVKEKYEESKKKYREQMKRFK